MTNNCHNHTQLAKRLPSTYLTVGICDLPDELNERAIKPIPTCEMKFVIDTTLLVDPRATVFSRVTSTLE